ncbi:MAG: tyrosine-type recombinase/integrase [Lachnospiraceae bacterium]|nr:tyrosine-type recombinase/integrase [Lachnospiraceae bacterium]
MKLYIKDLPYRRDLGVKEVSENHHLLEHAFNLDRLPNESLRCDFASFIFDRATGVAIGCLGSDQTLFHKVADFLSLYYQDIEHLTEVPLEDMIGKFKRYLMKNGYSLTIIKRHRGKELYETNPAILYLRKAYDYFTPGKDVFIKERDVWRTKTLPFELRASPGFEDLPLNFSKIKQTEIKKQVKEAALYRLKYKRPKTVKNEICIMNHLSAFLATNFPDLTTLEHFDRSILEEYFAYIYLESDNRVGYSHELYSLKSMLNDIGKLFGYDNLRGIFIRSDFPHMRKSIYKSYSDAELARLHEGYKTLDKQIARLLLIHEMLGLRISDTTNLKKADVFLGDDPHIRIYQPKTDKTYVKKINDEIVSLLTASIDYDNEHYGECEYIFVSAKDPTRPISRAAVNSRLVDMIQRLDLRDDNGKLFTGSTHILRHTYGKRLCDMFNDDATIAALLGHSSLQCVSYYRQMSPDVLAETAKPVIDKRNEMIKKHKKGWME